MKNITSVLVTLLVIFHLSSINPIAAENVREPILTPSETLNFPNGNMAYFGEINDNNEYVDTSGYLNGVYNNWVPRKLLYEIDYSFGHRFNGRFYRFSSSGTHHVEGNTYADGDMDNENQIPEIIFYQLSSINKSYALSDLVKNTQHLIHTSLGVMWLDNFNYDYVNDVLHIQTIDHQFYSFDIYTGNILYQSDVAPFTDIEIGSSVCIVGYDCYYYGTVTVDLGGYLQGEKIPVWVKCDTHIVSQIEDDRVLLGANGGINSWVPKDAIIGYKNLR